jgi:uncharacterized membrane protein
MRLTTIIKVWGLIGLLALAATTILMFMIAYSTPTKEVLVMIDNYGEADIELVLIISAIPCILYMAITYIQERVDEDDVKEDRGA